MTHRLTQRNDTALDFIVSDQGSIVLLKPCTPAAEAWVEENLGAVQKWGNSVAIERRYFRDVYEGIKTDGLVIA